MQLEIRELDISYSYKNFRIMKNPQDKRSLYFIFDKIYVIY